MVGEYLMRTGTWALSLALGGIGMFCLWASFYDSAYALRAVLLLSSATGLTLASQPKRSR